LLSILLTIVSLLERKHTSIQRMKELLFGMKEKKRGKDEDKNRAEDGRPGADGSSQTDSPNEMASNSTCEGVIFPVCGPHPIHQPVCCFAGASQRQRRVAGLHHDRATADILIAQVTARGYTPRRLKLIFPAHASPAQNVWISISVGSRDSVRRRLLNINPKSSYQN